MTETNVHYHADSPYDTARPAINVKDYHSGQDLVIAIERLIGAPAGAVLGESVNCRYPDSRLDLAIERITSDFWQNAEEIATQRGLGEITQEGRSGGWLVFTSADPQRPETLCPDHAPSADNPDGEPCDWADTDGVKEWLAGYRSMVEWADTWIADAPRKVAALAQSMAMDEAGESAARRMFAFGKGITA
jgi:hypothetical protein